MMIHKKSSLLVMRIPMNDVGEMNDVNEMNDVHQMFVLHVLHLHLLLQISLQNKACKMMKNYVKTILMQKLCM